MAGRKCNSCGSSNLEVDEHSDTVCTNCGAVAEESAIVSEVQFEENARGISSAIGQFVSADSGGGCRGFGSNFHASGVRESREITLYKAKRSITHVGQQLRLNQHCLDIAFNFYKMALSRHLTRGRRHTHIIAACLYITARIEGTPHLLIDFSDVLQICPFELGRTYIRLSEALCLNIPAVDPCLYVLRFANKLELGQKTHQVTMTALRLVQRMKKDSMHYGRRPSGICGAALLMASRLHKFNRTVGEIVKVVQVHQSTLRKRLVEFGETPSSSLTLQEFMSVDLEEEQDPPSYKAARLKDRERLQTFEENGQIEQFSKVQQEIERYIFDKKQRKSTICDEIETTNNEEGDIQSFVSSSTIDVLKELEEDEDEIAFGDYNSVKTIGLGPSTAIMGLDGETAKDRQDFVYEENGELDLEGLDDDELDMYILTEAETKRKQEMWTTNNADYLQKQKEKEEQLKKDIEEGKPPPEKKRKKKNRKKNNTPASSAGEAIEKMLKEKKLSSKINYDVLKNLNFDLKEHNGEELTLKGEIVPKEEVLGIEKLLDKAPLELQDSLITKQGKNSLKLEESVISKVEPIAAARDEDYLDDEDDPEPVEEESTVLSLSKVMNQCGGDDEDDYFDNYDDDEY